MAIFFVIIIWLVLCFVIADAGGKRKIGYGGAFWISFLLSPLLGFIFVLLSDRKPKGKSQELKEKINMAFENAKKEEFKNNNDQALSLYQDVLFYIKQADDQNIKISNETELKKTKSIEAIKIIQGNSN